jgi:acyl transferase domain-containing protein/NAD(P)-dependent dehydrogenase (short-subunit alcohol dehydrogenase family)/acyl carrier protein
MRRDEYQAPRKVKFEMKENTVVIRQILRNDNFIVRDHHVYEVRTLPGVALLDMIYRLSLDYIGSRAVELRKVLFIQPVVTSDQFDKEILVKFTPEKSHWKVSIESQKIKNSVLLDDAPQKNMECLLFLLEEENPSKYVDVTRFMQEADQEYDMEGIYHFARKCEISHFEFMKTLGTVYTKGNEEIMKLHLSDIAEKHREMFHAHPAFLDGSTFSGQSIQLQNDLQNSTRDQTPYIPFMLERFCIYEPLPSTIFTYSENSENWLNTHNQPADIKSTDVYIFNEAGRLLVEFRRFTMKRVRHPHLISNMIKKNIEETAPTKSTLDDLHRKDDCSIANEDYDTVGRLSVAVSKTMKDELSDYIQRSIASLLQETPEAISINDGFYDLGIDSTQLLSLTKDLERVLGEELYPTLLFEYSNIEVLTDFLSQEYKGKQLNFCNTSALETLKVDTTFEREIVLFESRWNAQPVSQNHIAYSDHDRLLVLVDGENRLREDIQEELSGSKVVSLVSEETEFAAQIEDKLVQLFLLVKEISQRKTKKKFLAQIVFDSGIGGQWANSFAGLLKTLHIEHPWVNSQIIFADTIYSTNTASLVSLLNEEDRYHQKGIECIYYDTNLQQRAVRQLNEISYSTVDSGACYREGGVYLITGGLGGIGFLLAKSIASRVKANLVLFGRSKLDDEKQNSLNALIELGSQAVYMQVNVCNAPDLNSAVDNATRRFGSITGVFHCAGQIQDQLIHKKDPQEFKQTLESKVRGLCNLDCATQQEQLDFFVLFSSISAITGNMGQADYASANAFMDVFADARQQKVSVGQRRGNTISINWPLWAGGGMEIDDAMEKMLFSESGLQSLPSEIGFDVMEFAIQENRTQLVPLFGDEVKIRQRFQSVVENLDTDNAKMQERPVKLSSVGTKELSSAYESYFSMSDTESCGDESGDIAIVGVAGRYPQAKTLSEFYNNLKEGKNSISSFPKDRWKDYSFNFDIDEYYCYGGFIDDIDQFDPLFFNLPPVKARTLDPQARIFLEIAWEACEDAGYSFQKSENSYRSDSENSVGVFVGSFWSHYELFAAEQTQRGNPMSLGVSPSSISNITSYCLNLHGPSIALDTMCSSALTSIHMACDSIRKGECHFALAGGVNVVAHPHKYIFLKQNQFLSTEGICKSFGEGGDGYVPGEGAGAVFLTTLERAKRLGYSIYGVIKGSAINHSGKTSGATVPNPTAQAEVITDALKAAKVDPRTLSYIEAHGTGTSLGDPIEIQGLDRAFNHWTSDKQFCAIGSSKSNIGHLEAAAGIAGLTKLLLQLKHKEIFPSLHAQTRNSLIPFHKTAFYIADELKEWERPSIEVDGKLHTFPRRAAISSFGASGSNAHLIVEEYSEPSLPLSNHSNYAQQLQVVVLSAKNIERLEIKAAQLLSVLQEGAFSDDELVNIAYTLQVGRQAMEQRVAIIVGSISDLKNELEKIIKQEACSEHVFLGSQGKKNVQALIKEENIEKAINAWIEDNQFALLLHWVEGGNVNWEKLHSGKLSRRISLPTYPFARKRYWVPVEKNQSDMQGSQRYPDDECSSQRTEEDIGSVTEREEVTVSTAASKQEALTTRPVNTSSIEVAPSISTSRQNSRAISLLPLANVLASEKSHAAPSQIQLIQLENPAGSVSTSSLTIGNTSLNRPPARHGVMGEQSLSQVKELLIKSFTEVLFIEVEDVDEFQVFSDFGLDSIVGVQWIKAVNKIFGTSYRATILYDHTNIEALAKFIHAALAETASVDNASLTLFDDTNQRLKTENDAVASADNVAEELNISLKSIRLSLINSFSAVLFLEENEIDIDQPFVDFGLDSIVGVQWIKAVNKEFKTSFKAMVLYDYSCIRKLADFIYQELSTYQKSATASEDIDIAENIFNAPTIIDIKNSLIKSLSTLLFLEIEDIDVDTSFDEVGLDSILGVQWIRTINSEFSTSFKATILYDYSDIQSLANYLSAELSRKIDKEENVNVGPYPKAPSRLPNSTVVSRIKGSQSQAINSKMSHAIAIVGASARYPGALDLDQFWDNLANGKNSIVEVPSARWDVDAYYDDQVRPNKTYSKWLGAIDDIEYFDPLFFNISPVEAEIMDPQQRVFLQEAYRAFDDAGYSKSDLNNTKCGVYLGILHNEYRSLVERSENGVGLNNMTGNSNSIAVARLAYFLNLKGPAIPIDTACSSSLVATHLACQALRTEEIDMALVGGATMYLLPESHLAMCQARMLSPEGQCKTFDNSANGFVPGEGVATLVLKRLEDAEVSRDNIQGVIIASGINQDGKTNGMTAPSALSQSALEEDVYTRYNIDPNSIQYIEMHGTGTKIGDPIELEGLTNAFRLKTDKKMFCAIGSVKTNIGHTSAAAGLAGIHKVLLCMKYRKLVPSLHYNCPNENFEFDESPFYVNTEFCDWDVAQYETRRACVSSFGMSGTNAHLVIEEYSHPRIDEDIGVDLENQPEVFLLSAKREDVLSDYARRMKHYIEDNRELSLGSICHTLQVGREFMKHRLAIICASREDLLESLGMFLENAYPMENSSIVFLGSSTKSDIGIEYSKEGENLDKDIQTWRDQRLYSKLAHLWVNGYSVDWASDNARFNVRKISLPTYPFARERYWIKDSQVDCRVQAETKGKLLPGEKTEQACFDEVKTHVQNENDRWLYTKEDWIEASFGQDLSTRTSLIDGRKNKRILVLSQSLRDYVSLSKAFAEIFPAENQISIKYLYLERDKQNTWDRYLSGDDVVDAIFMFKDHYKDNESDFNDVDDIGVVYEFCKRLLKGLGTRPVQFYYCCEYIGGFDDLFNDALSGLFRTVQAENASHRYRSIRFELETPDCNEHYRNIVEEWLQDSANTQPPNKSSMVRYSKNRRYLSEFSEIKNIPVVSESPKFRKSATYLMVGGFGEVGYQLCLSLVEKYSCHLVVLSRRPLGQEVHDRIERIERMGGKVSYFSTDITDEQRLIATYREMKLSVGDIHGVIHLARLVEDDLIVNKSFSTFKEVIAAKVQGTLNIDSVTSKEPLEFFIAFSSIGSFGLRGAADYAYSTAFQNSLVRYRNTLVKKGQRKGKSLALCWGQWDVDLYSDEKRNKLMSAMGLGFISIQSALPVIERFLSSADDVVGLLMTEDKEKVRRLFGLESKAVLGEKTIGTSHPEEEAQYPRVVKSFVSKNIDINKEDPNAQDDSLDSIKTLLSNLQDHELEEIFNKIIAV